MKKTLIACFVALSAATTLTAAVVESIIVRVGDRIVTRSQYDKRLREVFAEVDATVPPDQREGRKKQVKEQLVDEIINELLIKDRADRLGVVVSEPEIKDAMLRLKQQYNISTDEQFEASLKQSGMSRADMETRLRDTLITNKVFARDLRNRNELDDKELRERYNRDKENYRLPERAHLREIVILRPDSSGGVEPARQRAEEVVASVKGGADFAKTATTVSESGTKDKGGDLGEVKRGELLPDLDKAVFNAVPGAVIGPIETKSGWHILKVEQRLPSEVPAFESVKDRLRKDASDETFQRDLKAYLARLRKDAFIQINERNIPTA